jgi:uncharacterized protein (UPF0264 family)
LAGGADIIDAKEPTRGSLGAVEPEMLAAIIARVPGSCALSVALGDVASFDDVVAAITPLHIPARPGPVFLKLGFAGVRSQERVSQLLACAVEIAARLPARGRVVAVGYGDARCTNSLPPDTIPDIARRAGAAGVLLDTQVKDGISLLGWAGPQSLAEWVKQARKAGLIAALAGGLGPAEVARVQEASPDVLGVRGAACEGGREGRVTAERVRALRVRLAQYPSACVHHELQPKGKPGVRETRENGAISSLRTGPNSR